MSRCGGREGRKGGKGRKRGTTACFVRRSNEYRPGSRRSQSDGTSGSYCARFATVGRSAESAKHRRRPVPYHADRCRRGWIVEHVREKLVAVRRHRVLESKRGRISRPNRQL